MYIYFLLSCLLQMILIGNPEISVNNEMDEILVSETQMLQYQYIDSNGKVVIDAGNFISARGFSNGLAAVQAKNGLWGFINKEGKFVIEPKYEEVGDFSEGVVFAKLPEESFGLNSNSQVYINTLGEVIFQTNFEVAFQFSEGVALAQDAGMVYLVDGNGQIRKLFDMDTFLLEPENPKFSAGLLAIQGVEAGKYGYLDMNGKLVISPRYENATSFSDGLARVTIIEKGREMLGFLDVEGKFTLLPTFDINHDFLRNSRDFSDGLAGVAFIPPATVDIPTYNFINKLGKTIFKTSSIDVGQLKEGRIFVYYHEAGKYGYVDRYGNLIIPPTYTLASDFSEGLACVAIMP